MNKTEVRSRIEAIGIIPAVRAYSAEDARFAAEAVSTAGIPIVEITMTVPGALHVISDLVQHAPDTLVGAGSVLDTKNARQCLDAGAVFLTTDGLDLGIVEYAVKENVVVFPGVLTPTEVLTAWKAGADLVKVVPCAQVGGDSYIKALKAPFPQIPMIAAGGVNQQTATSFILAGAVALGVGVALIPRESMKYRQADRIRNLRGGLSDSWKRAAAISPPARRELSPATRPRATGMWGRGNVFYEVRSSLRGFA